MATKYTSIVQIASEDELTNLASKISNYIQPGQIIGLNGELGTGKTTFVRHFCKAMGSHDWVNSPTYTLMQKYKSGTLNIIHVDLYRCESEQSIEHLNLENYVTLSSILIIEWINKTKLLRPSLTINLSYTNSMSRLISIESEELQWVETLNHTNPN